MKTGFKETNSIKSQNKKDSPVDGKGSPWDFRCPQYDQRTGAYVNAGTDYGVGYKQPVGTQGNPKERAETLPMGRVKTMVIDEI